MNRIKANMGFIDRAARGVVAVALALAGVFWLYGILAAIALALAAVLTITACLGFCPLYVPLRIDTGSSRPRHRRSVMVVLAAVLVAEAVVGAYASNFFTRKLFLEDYNRMNQPYKQVLFETGQGQMRAAADYSRLVSEHAKFQAKYAAYRPPFLRRDVQFNADVDRVAAIIVEIESDVHGGNMAAAHAKLENIRAIYQDMLKRNGFSMLAIYLVDFHDAMEKVLEPAAAKEAAGVTAAYAEADAKLKEVEAAADDAEIQAIRAALEAVRAAAADGQSEVLPDLGAKLKSSFVKVYLQRG